MDTDRYMFSAKNACFSAKSEISQQNHFRIGKCQHAIFGLAYELSARSQVDAETSPHSVVPIGPNKLPAIPDPHSEVQGPSIISTGRTDVPLQGRRPARRERFSVPATLDPNGTQLAIFEKSLLKC